LRARLGPGTAGRGVPEGLKAHGMTPTQKAEAIRRRRLVQINHSVESNSGIAERHRLEAPYGKIWDAAQLADDFDSVVYD
jgi:hypothetical protein